jgi:hypothetical protein
VLKGKGEGGREEGVAIAQERYIKTHEIGTEEYLPGRQWGLGCDRGGEILEIRGSWHYIRALRNRRESVVYSRIVFILSSVFWDSFRLSN